MGFPPGSLRSTTSAWDHSLGELRLEYLTWELSFLGTLSWELALRISALRASVLEVSLSISVWDLSLKNFPLGAPAQKPPLKILA